MIVLDVVRDGVSVSSGSTFMTVPEGFRPSMTMGAVHCTINHESKSCAISPNGNVTVYSNATNARIEIFAAYPIPLP